MKPTTVPTRRALTGTAVIFLALAVIAGAEQPAAPPAVFGVEKPAWLTDLSLGVKESYDDNLFLVSGDAGPKQSSWATTVSPKVGVNFAPLLGDATILQVLSVGYAPDFVLFHNDPNEAFNSHESYNAHRSAQNIKGKADAFSFNLENGLNYVDGSSEAPVYAGSDKYRSSFASAVPKERRRQFQDRAKAFFQYDWGAFFLRPTASLLDYDMMTQFRSTAGYQNYADRADVNGGADVGYRVSSSMAVTLGYRYGHQYQEQLPLAIDKYQFASDSDYQRVLLGLEGKPWPWLTVAMQGGPDFRNYADTAAVIDHHPITYYGEASLGAELSPNDALTFKYRQWRFVAYGGRLPIFDSNYELSYRRKVTQRLSLDLGGRIGEADFTCGNDPTGGNLRDDLLFSVSVGLTYAFTSNLSINAAYTLDLGRNEQNNPPGGSQFREFDHDLVSLAAQFKF